MAAAVFRVTYFPQFSVRPYFLPMLRSLLSIQFSQFSFFLSLLLLNEGRFRLRLRFFHSLPTFERGKIYVRPRMASYLSPSDRALALELSIKWPKYREACGTIVRFPRLYTVPANWATFSIERFLPRSSFVPFPYRSSYRFR